MREQNGVAIGSGSYKSEGIQPGAQRIADGRNASVIAILGFPDKHRSDRIPYNKICKGRSFISTKVNSKKFNQYRITVLFWIVIYIASPAYITAGIHRFCISIQFNPCI